MPEAAVRLARGERYTVRGVAYAGARGVRAVECSVDGGGRWGVAQLDYRRILADLGPMEL